MIKIPRIKVPRAFLLFLGTTLAVELYVAHADTATYYWDPTKTGGEVGGPGMWDGASLSWSSATAGGTDAAWLDGSNAVFGGTMGTVTLGAPVTVGNLTIATAGYAIATTDGNPLTVSGGITTSYTSTGASNFTGTGGLVMNGDQTINVVDGGVGMNISTVLSGSGVITKAGAGSLGLNQTNTFSGKWVVTGGLLGINSDAAPGADPAEFQADNITLDGGGLAVGVNFSRATGFSKVGTVTLGANRGITLGPGGGILRVGFGSPGSPGGDVLIVNGNITGVGALLMTDSGTLILNGNNTYQGGTSVSGTLQIGTGGTTGNLGAGDITFTTNNKSNNFLYFDRSDDVTITNNITGAGKANIGSMNGGRVILTGAFLGTGEFWINGTGTVVVSPTDLNKNTRTTSNVIVSGTLEVSDLTRNVTSALGSGNIYIGQSTTPSTGAGLRYTGDSVTTDAIQNVQTPYGFMDITKAGTTLTTTNTIKGSDGSDIVTKLGAGTWDVAGATDNTRLSITLNAGTVILDKVSQNNPGVHAVSGLIVNAGLLRLAGSGDDQIYDATAVQVNGGVFDMNGHGEAFASLAGTGSNAVIANNLSGTFSTLTVSGNNTNTVYAGKIQDGTGQVSLVKSGTGALTLTGNNNITGSTELKSGRLIVSGSLTGSTTFVEGGVLGGTGTLGDVTVIAGTISPGATARDVGLGTLHTGSLDLTGAVYEGVINTSTLAASLAEIQGDLTVGFSGALLTLTDLGGGTGDAVGTKFTLMSYTGSWDGGIFSFGAAGFIDNNQQFTFGSNTFQLTYDAIGLGPNEHDVVLTVVSSVPEPASAGLLLGGVTLLAGCRRRKSGGRQIHSIANA